jgi:predicted nucleic acid-binding protein
VILVDSSVWINYFNGNSTAGTMKLDDLLNRQRLTLKQLAGYAPLTLKGRIAIGDLILTEVLQGLDDDREFAAARTFLMHFNIVELAGRDIAVQAAKNFQLLRAKGATVRKTIDTLIATRCIESGHELLYDDRDFDPFVKHLGLKPPK